MVGVDVHGDGPLAPCGPAGSDEPATALAWLERAAELYERRTFEAASRAYDRAIRLGAPPAAPDVSRSIVDMRNGDVDAALKHSAAAVETQPCSIMALMNAAVVEGPLLGYERTLYRLDAARAAGAREAQTCRLRADALLRLQRHAEALREADRALCDASADWSTIEIRATALAQLGRQTEACAFLDGLAAGEPSGELFVRLAVMQMELGRRDDAFRSLRSALERNAANARAWYLLADLDGFDCAGADLIAVGRLLEADALLDHDRILLRFALGKALLAKRDHASAFAHFQAGNDMKRRLFDYDVGEDVRAMAELVDEFPAASLAAGVPGANPSERPIFVVGMPRSGTSLIEQMLAAHPAVHGAGELGDLFVLARLRRDLPRDGWAALGERYLAAAAAHAGSAERVVDKLPLNFINVGFIRLVLPNARIVHCRRDAVDNGLSCFTTLFDEGNQFSYDLTEQGRFARAYSRLMEHWRAALPPDRFLDVQYEDVVADVRTEAGRLLAFCGLPWDDAVLRFHETERPVRTASKLQVRKAIYRTSVDRAAAFGAALDPLRAALAAP